ncbi:translation initiation factor eIF3 subunit g [Massospora cicadina]|nr:translation initiation factor eIF3 subunit g [Massospora cicadina]
MVKITRKIKMILKKEHVNRAVAERKTTSVGEQIFLKLSANQAFQEDADDGDKQKNLLKGKKILCRILNSKKLLLLVANIWLLINDVQLLVEKVLGNLCLTSEDTRESDIYDLFRKFGHIARVFLAKDYDTGLCKGFAFVSFSLREEADRARQALDGHGYANLILRVEWSQ